MTFEEFFAESLKRSGVQNRRLIAEWDRYVVERITQLFEEACRQSNIIGSRIPRFDGLTNQARGNAAADHFVETVSLYFSGGANLARANGAGYPDRLFKIDDQIPVCCLELKATRIWNPADGNRRVLGPGLITNS